IWNGEIWNGEIWNGEIWNGEIWNGLGWDQHALAGPGWYGLGWHNNSQSWDANAWGGTTTAQDCTVTPNNNSCTTLHNWVNHLDFDGNGIPGEANDRQMAVKALAYWVSCACASNVAIPFSDTHGLLSTTLYGGLGLAPNWCGSSASL